MNFHRPAIALPAFGEPFSQRRSKARRLDAEAGLERALAGGKRVVELGCASEVAHAEAVEPLERAGAALARDYHLHLQLPRIHRGAIIAPRCMGLCGGRLALMQQQRGGSGAV